MGRPVSEKSFANHLRIAVSAKTPDGSPKLRQIAERLCSAAMAGEGWAIREVADRLDGKSVQQIEGDLQVSYEDRLQQLFKERGDG